MENNKTGVLGRFFLSIPLSIIGGIYLAFVLSQLWSIFIAPIFDIPEIGMRAAYGVFLFASVIQFPIHKRLPEKEERSLGDMCRSFVFSIIGYTMFWGIGGIVSML